MCDGREERHVGHSALMYLILHSEVMEFELSQQPKKALDIIQQNLYN